MLRGVVADLQINFADEASKPAESASKAPDLIIPHRPPVESNSRCGPVEENVNRGSGPSGAKGPEIIKP